MKLNKKGITLIEIIISIALISIVLLFLFSLLVQVNDMNKESEVNSTYLINKSLMLKNIESDLLNYNKIQIKNYSSNPTDCIYKFYKDISSDKPSECIEMQYYNNDEQDGNNAYIAIYYYTPKENYVISYIHGNVKTTRELSDFGSNTNNIKDNKITNKIRFTNKNGIERSDVIKQSSSNYYKIEIPIFGPDGKDYSIIIPFYGIVSKLT